MPPDFTDLSLDDYQPVKDACYWCGDMTEHGYYREDGTRVPCCPECDDQPNRPRGANTCHITEP